MKKTVTFEQILVIISILVLPLLSWGVSVESRFSGAKAESTQKTEQIQHNAEYILRLNDKLDEMKDTENSNFLRLMQEIQKLGIKIENKKDRD